MKKEDKEFLKLCGKYLLFGIVIITIIFLAIIGSIKLLYKTDLTTEDTEIIKTTFRIVFYIFTGAMLISINSTAKEILKKTKKEDKEKDIEK